ncbi:MAG: tetratricopeptide repeat protein [Bacteroidetes bacterium]|jgi:serine/threonine-protein kinase|nr:tetratricopeptide repeat protein [Bacteroidota bacterium]
MLPTTALQRLTQQQWQRIDALLDATLDLPPDERVAVLDAECADAPALRQIVEALLDAATDTSFLDEAAVDFALPLLPDVATAVAPAVPLEGRRVGAYRLREQLGRGGMGIVYRATRDDGHFEQDVAIKLLHPTAGTPEMVRRFEQERQILALLRDPGIARLLDGGVLDDGTPYLVMEYVDGQPIDAYCDARADTLPERLRLFMQVVEAVQHAHQQLIIHRDLKPSNILVTEPPDGGTGRAQVKLLDFGIAKLLDASGPATRALTTGTRLLTPEYAAPEQLRGNTVSTSTDVYSLGVVLYEVLTGTHPFAPHVDRSALHVARAVLHEDPPPPSQQKTPIPLDGDLDAVVLKAMRKEPEQRYPTAEALLDDLARYLDGLPVRARRGGWRYRAGKFVRRNRMPLVAGAALLVLLLALGAFHTQRVAAERDRVAQEAQKYESVAGLLVDLFEASNPALTEGDTLTVEQLLEQGRARIHGLEDEPLVQAEMQTVLGSVYLNRGQYARADTLYREAVATYRAQAPPDPDALAEALTGLGTARRMLDRLDAAVPPLRASLQLQRDHLGTERPEYAYTLNMLAIVLENLGRYAEAETVQQEALQVERAVLGPDHPRLAVTHNNLAVLYVRTERIEDARRHLREAERIGRASADTSADARTFLAGTLRIRSTLASRQGRPADAVTASTEALALITPIYGAASVTAQAYRARRGAALSASGQPDAGVVVLEAALDGLIDALGPAHARVVLTQVMLGRAYERAGRLADARAAYDAALRQTATGPAASTRGAAQALLASADLHCRLGDAERGREQAERGARLVRSLYVDNHSQHVAARSIQAACQAARGDVAGARPVLAASLDRLRARWPAEAPLVRRAQARLDRVNEAARPALAE